MNEGTGGLTLVSPASEPVESTVLPLSEGEEVGAPGMPPLAELAGLLAAADSGLAFVYLALDVVAARYGLRDAAMVIDDARVGRQVFRLRRPRGRTALTPPLGPPDEHGHGFYADPPVVDRITATYVTHLAEVALRWDLARRDAGVDPLTGLGNRRSYEGSLDRAMASSRRYGWPFALMLMDMDDFKLVNDELGHAGGDAVLQALGVELRASLRSGDVAARIGGDEFALIILNADSAEMLDPVRARLQGALDRTVFGMPVRFSAGVACFPRDADNAADLVRIADQRLYAAKSVA